MREPLYPFGTGFFVVVLHTAAGLQNFIRAHGGIADKHQFVVFVVLANHVPSVEFFSEAAPVVLPQKIVNAVVEIEKFQMFEFAFNG